jgi:hypothetical protein
MLRLAVGLLLVSTILAGCADPNSYNPPLPGATNNPNRLRSAEFEYASRLSGVVSQGTDGVDARIKLALSHHENRSYQRATEHWYATSARAESALDAVLEVGAGPTNRTEVGFGLARTYFDTIVVSADLMADCARSYEQQGAACRDGLSALERAHDALQEFVRWSELRQG